MVCILFQMNDLFIKKNNTDPYIARTLTSQNYERKILRISMIDDIDVTAEFKLLNDIKEEFNEKKNKK